MYEQSLEQAGKGCKARDCWCWRAVGRQHAGWFARKGPGPSWRLHTQPTHGPVPGQQIREMCAGMLFLSRALEQE